MSDTQLGDGDKVLCGVINGLTRERGYCFASNKYLAKYTGKSERTISRSLSTLESRGHIYIGAKTSSRRKIALTMPNLAIDHDKNGDVTTTKMATDGKSDIRSDIRNGDIKVVFDFWVIERKKRLHLRGPTPKLSEGRRSKINARMDEGYTVADLKDAILGMLSSEYNVKGGYTDIELVCRSAQKVDQYRSWHQAGGRPSDDRKPRWDETPPEPKEWQ
jgi:hypothetical protein